MIGRYQDAVHATFEFRHGRWFGQARIRHALEETGGLGSERSAQEYETASELRLLAENGIVELLPVQVGHQQVADGHVVGASQEHWQRRSAIRDYGHFVLPTE